MPIKVTQAEMNSILVGVEHGFKEAEKGKNLQAAMASVFDHFELKTSSRESATNKRDF
jgi:hypothetical protein